MAGVANSKDFLEVIAGDLTAYFSRIMEQAFGPRVHDPVIGVLTWADFIILLGSLLLVLLVHSMAALLLSRQAHRKTSEPTAIRWRSHVFAAVSKPLYLFIWVYGVYIVSQPLLLKLASDDAPHPAQLFIGKLFDVGVFVVLFWLFFRFTHDVEVRLVAWTKKSQSKWDDIFVPMLGRSARIIIPVVGIILALPLIGLPPAYSQVVSKVSSLMVIGAISWILFQGVKVVEQMILIKYDINVADNLQARKVHTQIQVISRTAYVLIAIFSIASALMLFEEVRRFGTSILASAGVIGIIVGFAAQRTIANLFAGFQLAMSQPVRLDDVVIVEGEWGRVEEINLTYVVVHIWDDRRLVVPLSQFIEKPFQNWTRVSAQLLGSVFVWVDYNLPIAELRREVKNIVEGCADWDRRFWNLQITDSNERAMQLRVLATAADSGKSWDLRCEIREKMIALIQKNYPHSLPRVRAELTANTDHCSAIPGKSSPGELQSKESDAASDSPI